MIYFKKNSILLFILGASTCACTPSYYLSQPIIDTNNDIFSSKPIWNGAANRHSDAAFFTSTTINSVVNTTIAANRPGLTRLVWQVFPTSNESKVKLTTTSLDENEANPLPKDIASTNLCKVLVSSMLEHELARLGLTASDYQEFQQKNDVPSELSLNDFKIFLNAISKSLVEPLQNNSFQSLNTNKANWKTIFTAYFMAYYNGNFVDRDGGTYSKPKLSLTISNEIISNIVIIFIESTIDYTLFDSKGLNVPVVWKPNGEDVEWLTNGNKQPTFIDVATQLDLWNPKTKVTSAPNLIDKEDINKIDAIDLCVSRYAGGVAGDAAQPMVGTIVRAMGGANLGFTFGLGALGKFSFGDNDTLTKLVDAFVETIPKRLSAIAVEDTLYGPQEKKGTLKTLYDVSTFLSSCK